ncbi:putative transcription factor C2H2 family [Helianthus annuus]|nr:putative transcription factor C2H2 family [Helianthus annuus]KAJ0701794.1 putative transcription factor C2H2 family [Helianthus annuus]
MSQKGVEKPLEEYEKVRCPICMEHPHQAILLLCSSHDKGCRPYICDTGRNHSNCFSMFKNTRKKLLCPLCRGKVHDWTVDARAQHFMNHKTRTCANGTCTFSGSYMDLEHHVRMVHPSDVGPSGSDGPVSENVWMDLENYLNQLNLSHR